MRKESRQGRLGLEPGEGLLDFLSACRSGGGICPNEKWASLFVFSALGKPETGKEEEEEEEERTSGSGGRRQGEGEGREGKGRIGVRTPIVLMFDRIPRNW